MTYELLTYACLSCSFFSYYRLEKKKTTYECFEASYDSSGNKLKKGFSLPGSAVLSSSSAMLKLWLISSPTGLSTLIPSLYPVFLAC